MCTNNSAKFKVSSAIDLWQEETSLPSIPTFSKSLDNILGNNGIQLGLITEVLGLPGSGKTQLCMQLCASVQIPKSLGGLEAEALYIDTNTNFSIERFQEILLASYNKWQTILDSQSPKNIADLLHKFHYIDGFGLEKFCAVMYQMPVILAQRPHIKLIVIDSIMFPFKEGVNESDRLRLMYEQTQQLHQLTIEKRIAVVLTNEMTTRVGLADTVVGAGGDSWSHRSNCRLLLSTDSECGYKNAAVLKSNGLCASQCTAVFQDSGTWNKK